MMGQPLVAATPSVRRQSRVSLIGLQRRVPWSVLAYAAGLAVILYLALTPGLMLLFSSVKATANQMPFDAPGFTLSNFALVLTDAATYSLLLGTIFFAVVALAVSLSLSVTLAYVIERTDVPGQRLLRTLVLSPMAIPPIVLAIAWVLLANPRNGLLNVYLGGVGLHMSVYSLVGLACVTGLSLVPSVYVMLAPSFSSVDPALEEAAALSGAGWLSRTARITVRLATPALLASGMFFFIVCLEMFDIPAVIGMPNNIYVFSTLIYQSIHTLTGLPNFGRASVYGCILFLFALALVLLYRRAMRQPDRYRTITGRGYRSARVQLGRWRGPAVGLVVLYVLVGLVLPLLVLVWSSLLKFYEVPSLTAVGKLSLSNYLAVVAYPGIGQATVNTIVIASTCATVTLGIAVWAAWTSVRKRMWGSWLAVESSFLVLGIPGVVIALAILFLYLSLPRLGLPDITGTIWIIVIAYVTRFLPFSVRLMDAAARQIDRELEEAAHVSGASPAMAVRRVLLPLLAPAIGRGWLWVALHAIKEVPIAAMLYVVANQTIAVAVWQAWTNSTGVTFVSAFAILLTAVWAIGIFVTGRLGGALRDY